MTAGFSPNMAGWGQKEVPASQPAAEQKGKDLRENKPQHRRQRKIL